MAIEGSANLTALRSLRTLRALRPLRAISRWQGMKVCKTSRYEMMLDAIAMAGSRKCVRGVSAVARGDRGVSRGSQGYTNISDIVSHKTSNP